MTSDLYTARDPRYEVTCVPCSFGFHEGCIGGLHIPAPSPLAGDYRCACFRCRCVGRAS